MQLEEDTDRDRYMSPLEAKSYGLIDHVIGGDDAGFKFTVRCCMTPFASACCSVSKVFAVYFPNADISLCSFSSFTGQHNGFPED
jgi:Clp protease